MKKLALFAAFALASALLPGVLNAADAERTLRVSAEIVAPARYVDANAQKAWKRSLLPLLASQSLDAASSYGMRELNPVLADSRGAFGMRATTMKLGVVGAFAGVEYVIVRKHPGAARVFSKLNWTAAGITTGVAVHNFAIR